VVLVEPGGFKTGIWTEMENDIERHAAAGSRYTDAYRRSLQGQRMLQVIMGEPAACARVIGRAITTWVPRSRYLVGLDAQAMAIADQLTPTFVKDRFIRFGLGL
jgi:hypothetical protein